MPSSSALPVLTWRFVGRNAYGEAVEETADGHRRVATEQGWQPETTLAAWRACRVTTPVDARLAMASLADPWVSEGFGHNLSRAYLTYRLAPGESWAARPPEWGTAADPRWKVFETGVARARGQRVLRAWLHRRPQAPDVPKWATALHAPGATAPRGLQWGLAHRLEAWAQAHPAWSFYEAGLVDGMDAATARLPAARRQAWAAKPSPAWAAAAQIHTGWPPLPGHSAAFGKKPVATWPATACPVFWCLPASLQAHGPLGGWWEALAGQAQGMVVFPDRPGATAQPLAAALKNARRPLRRWRIAEVAEVWAWGAPAGPMDEALTLEQWAVPVDPFQPSSADTGTDERVPYRALSRVGEPEGVAGRALEANMHAALLDFVRAHPGVDIDRWVADGLGVSAEALAEALSPEQVDAVALARQSLEGGHGFLLSDETGFGKGRALATLALTGLGQGRAVVFVTENPFLFSDFYRDLLAVRPSRAPVPTLLHQSATVADPNGRKVARSLKSQAFRDMLKRRQWEEGEDRIVFTTYAQLARANDDTKLRWLKDRLGRGEGWLLLDEAHNAAGESSIGKRIDELVASSGGTVFASATFAKHEANLSLYKPVLALPPPAQRLLKLALAGDDGRLREALTHQMARSGRLVRREHPPVPPPTPVWVEMTVDRQVAVAAFSSAWRGIFEAAGAFSRLFAQRESLWLLLGSALSRSVREFSLQLKADALVETVVGVVDQDKKAVVVVDTTMEAALREALTPVSEEVYAEDEGVWEDDGAVEGVGAAPPQMVRSGTGVPPLWRDRLGALLEAVCPKAQWEHQTTGAAEDAREAYDRARAALESLPAWDLAPLDRVRRDLAARGVEAGELSGRQTRLLLTAQSWDVIARNDPDRNAVVRAFNHGELDVLFVTRAGCAGISLHAGRKFPDQRVRCLIEWDIAANPVNRVQFLGRVRRKDQVVEPEFWGLVLDTPEDRRIVEREDRKRRRLTAHLGTRPGSQVGWVSELGESLVAEWAEDRPRAAFQIGVTRPLPELPMGRVDRALVRSLVLPETERQGLLARLDRGIELGAPAFLAGREDRAHRPSRALQRAWWWGDPTASTADPAQALAALRLDLVERVWRPEPGAGADEVGAAVQAARAEARSGAQVLAEWRQAWDREHRAGVPTTPTRRASAQWALTHLKELDVGRAVAFQHPGTQRLARAVVLGWSVPPDDPVKVGQGAGAWAPSQIALQVWAAGDRAPLTLPLSVLMKDKAFRATGRAASTAWFNDPPVPQRCLSIEGHPVQAAAWGQRWGWGRTALVRDEDEGAQVVWLLPPRLAWADAWGLPRDLIDVEHALLFWRDHPTQALAAALPHGQRLQATPVQGGLRLAFDTATLKHAQATWLHHGLVRRLRLQPVPGEPEWQATVVRWKFVPALLHGLAGAGIVWRAPARFLSWYTKTSPERTRARSG